MAYTTITIGYNAVSSSYGGQTGYTAVNTGGSAANATGILNSISMYFKENGSGVKVGTFSNDGSSNYTSRDYENIGNVTSGSVQTFTGLNIDTIQNDLIGIYYSSEGDICVQSQSNKTYSKSGDQFNGSQFTASGALGPASLYGSGVTVPDAPTNVSATDNLTDKVTITWTAGTGETGGHRVYRDTVDISGVVAHGTATYDDTTAVAGTTYSYTVKAINDAGLSAASSADNGIRLSTFVPRIMIF